MSNFRSNALVKCNVGISCSAGLKAPFCEVSELFRDELPRLDRPVHCSLATSYKGVRRKENVFRKNKPSFMDVHCTLCGPNIDRMRSRKKFYYCSEGACY